MCTEAKVLLDKKRRFGLRIIADIGFRNKKEIMRDS